MNHITIPNLIRIFKKSCRLTYTFEHTFWVILTGAFVFMEVGVPNKFRPDLKKISNRNLINFVFKSDPNLNKNIKFSIKFWSPAFQTSRKSGFCRGRDFLRISHRFNHWIAWLACHCESGATCILSHPTSNTAARVLIARVLNMLKCYKSITMLIVC